MFSPWRLYSSPSRGTRVASPLFPSEFHAAVTGWGHIISRVANIIPGMRPLFPWIVGIMGTVLCMSG